MKFYSIFGFLVFFLCSNISFAQKGVKPIVVANNDTNSVKKIINKDTAAVLKKKHNPKLATKRSAILPGWGQAYNKEYWKIPIVYGAISIPTVTFFYNNTWYKRTKIAYDLLYKMSATGAVAQDTLNYNNLVNDKLKGFSLGSLQTFRNSFRKDRDYSVLWFLAAWGLNVVDATVFGNLKEYDVSDDLSMRVEPMMNPTTHAKGFSLVVSLKKPAQRLVSVK